MRNKRQYFINFSGDEDVLQILYLLELRFPGYTREVREFFYEVEEEYNPKPNRKSIAQLIAEKFDPDLTDKKNSEHNKNHILLRSKEHSEAVLEWLDTVERYEGELERLKREGIDKIFRKTFGISERQPLCAEVLATSKQESKRYENWLRYAIWTPEEAVEFSLGENMSTEHYTRLKQLEEAT
ncbi:hypothetical protein [Pseudovibrio sp. SCP19]|uniref:hypothetical protein n=1 Tax=Pseudovibrio sp. SCP19 TaxID=3141374 RepID=UPI0033373EFE